MCILCFSLYLLFFFIPYSHHQHFRLNRLSVRMHTHFIARKEKSLLGLHNTLNTTRSRQHISLPPVSRSFLSPHRHLCQRINSLACRLSIKAQNHTHTHIKRSSLSLFLQSLCRNLFIHCIYFHPSAASPYICLLKDPVSTFYSSSDALETNCFVPAQSSAKEHECRRLWSFQEETRITACMY